METKMPLIEDYIQDVTPALVIVPDTLDANITKALDAEIAKWPDAEKDREFLRDQLVTFFSVHGYLPEFTLTPRET
jgi:hypothetical protein